MELLRGVCFTIFDLISQIIFGVFKAALYLFGAIFMSKLQVLVFAIGVVFAGAYVAGIFVLPVAVTVNLISGQAFLALKQLGLWVVLVAAYVGLDKLAKSQPAQNQTAAQTPAQSN